MGAYCLMTSLKRMSIRSFVKELPFLSFEQYNVKKRTVYYGLGQLFQEVRDHHNVCALYGGVHLRIAIHIR